MMSIGDVARQAGLRASAIRYYERMGLLPAPARASGRRRYDERVLFQLQMIAFARRSGFTLREIRQLFAGRPYSARLRKLAGEKMTELDAVISRAHDMQRLLQHALRCSCITLEECGRRMRASAGGEVRAR
jgi:MerR family transcriptional regulator, redox-sensitive transcriptional activator SoxR